MKFKLMKKSNVSFLITNNEHVKLTWRLRIKPGFTPARISLPNSSSVIHADLLTTQNNND